MSRCQHADSGCNYPEGECAGLCMSGAPIGMCLTVLHHDYTITLQRENDALRALNMQLLKDADAAMHCEPRDEQSKAIMQRINGDLRCEIHTIRKGI